MLRVVGVLAAIAVLFAVPTGTALYGQTNTGRITGIVTDESGAVIPGVEILVKNPSTGLTRNTITNESGNYQVPLLPPGVYDVEAALAGFSTGVRSGITVQVDAVPRVDLVLKVGEISDKVQVIADAPWAKRSTRASPRHVDAPDSPSSRPSAWWDTKRRSGFTPRSASRPKRSPTTPALVGRAWCSRRRSDIRAVGRLRT